jgi:hypothetical protein
MSDYQKELDIQKKASEAQAAKTAQAQAFYDFYMRNRDSGVIACDANTSLLRQFLGDNITAQSLQDAYEHTSVGNRLAHIRPDEERENLVEFIISHRKMQERTAQEERKRLMDPLLTDISTIRVIADRVRNRRELEAKSVDELKEMVKPEPYSTPTDLPSHISAAQILHMWDAVQMRHMMAKYGSAAITKRVNEGKREDQ